MTATIKTTVIKEATSATDNITLDSSGNVTIGSTTTSGDYQINLSSGSSDALVLRRYSGGLADIGNDGANLRLITYTPNSIIFQTDSTERLRIGSSGQIGIGGANYGTSGQVLTSGGSGAAPSWADASGGGLEYVGGISSASSSWNNLTSISQYKSLIVMIGVSAASASITGRLRISDSNGSSWGTTWSITAGLSQTAFAYVTVFITNTDQTSTNKTLYVNRVSIENADASTGTSNGGLDTNTETTETGIIDAVGVSLSGSGGVITGTVYGVL